MNIAEKRVRQFMFFISKSLSKIVILLIPYSFLLLANNLFAATITVATTSDGSGCTFRNAVAQINAGFSSGSCSAIGAYGTDDRIEFSLPANSIIQLQNSPIEIKKSLTIQGVGQNDLAIRPATGQQGLIIGDGSQIMSVVILDIGFEDTNRENMDGGAIYLNGESTRLSLRRTKFQNNFADRGAAVMVHNGSLTIVESSFLDNAARRWGAAVFYDALSGGERSFRIAASEFRDNLGFVGLQSLTTEPDGGAAVYVEGADELSITESNFEGNRFIPAPVSRARGGAVMVQRIREARIVSNIFKSNQNKNGWGGALATVNIFRLETMGVNEFDSNEGSFGGAVYCQDLRNRPRENGKAFFIANTYINNSAEKGGAFSGISCNIEHVNSTWVGNKASIDGGAIYADTSMDINQNTFVANESEGNGGALFLENSTISLQNSAFVKNRASDDGADIASQGSNFLAFQNNFIGDNQITKQDSIDGFFPPPGNFYGTSDSSMPKTLEQLFLPFDNSGRTGFFLPRVDSPLVDAGVNTNCFRIDQLGRSRDDGKCDIGSMELRPQDIIDQQGKESSFFVIPLANGKAVIFEL